jgi:dCTP deaminase
MVLVDFQIKEYCEKFNMVAPFNPELINPASIDLRVGNTAKIEVDSGWTVNNLVTTPNWVDIDLTEYTKDNPFWLKPKAFILVATLETFNMPDFLAAEFRLKSSRAREGYDNSLAVWLDPQWSGSVLTMEISNKLRFASLPLYHGQKIGQAIFYRCEHVPQRTYQETGRYNGDSTVMSSKG